MNEFQKVATLLAHLDADARRRILERLPDSQRRALESCLLETSFSESDSLTELVREYQCHLVGLNSQPHSESIEDVTETVTVATDRIDIPFPVGELLGLLSDESDSIVTAVIAYLPETQADELFRLLSADRRDRVTSLLSVQRELSAAVIDEISRYLRDKYARMTSVPRGTSVLNRLLSGDEELPELVEGNVESEDRSLLQRLRRLYR